MSDDYKKEFYDWLLSYPQLKDITEDERATLIAYFDNLETTSENMKQQIFDRCEKIWFDLVWSPDDPCQIYLMYWFLQEVAVAIWILNDKKLPDATWLINNYLDYRDADAKLPFEEKKLLEPLAPKGETKKCDSLKKACGYAGHRITNRYALWVIESMNKNVI